MTGKKTAVQQDETLVKGTIQKLHAENMKEALFHKRVCDTETWSKIKIDIFWTFFSV